MQTFYSLLYRTLFFLLLASSLVAQPPKAFSNLNYEVEAGVLLSSAKSNPFWLRSNQYGEVPLQSQLSTLRGQARKEYDSTGRFSYGYGARVIVNAGSITQVVLPELYAKVRYRAFELYAGRRREIVGLVDTTLSAGSYIWSGNALPVPKVQLSIPDYTPVLFKNKILAVKGQFSHGWFGSGDSTRNYYLHQTALYVRLGKPAWRFKMHGGFNHQAQWGGSPTVPFYDGFTQTTVTNYANSIEAYVNIALGIPIDYNTQKFRTGGQIYGEGNRAGNHLGSLDFALEYQRPGIRWLLYRQSVYDDGSLFYLSNIADGLSGISWATRSSGAGIKRVVVEYLHTSNQGGPFSARVGVNVLRGQDDYFNNGVYEDGWVYRQNTIGTAFLMPLQASTGIKPVGALATANPRRIFNNRANALIVSAQSRIGKVELVTRVSYSKNLGNYSVDYAISINQLSLLQQVSFPVKHYIISTSLAYDGAGILEKNVGLMLLVKRTF